MVVAFTGTHKLERHHHPQVDTVLDRLVAEANAGHITEFVSGTQVGLDAYAGRYMIEHCPDALHRLVVPAEPGTFDSQFMTWATNESRTNPRIDIWPMPPLPPQQREHKRAAAIAYRARDQYMVDACARLVGFPLHEEQRMKYSGTWLTIRLGRKAAACSVEYHLLEPQDAVLF